MFLCIQGLPFLELSAEKRNTSSNIFKEYCEHFQLIFLHPLISPEYSSIGYFAQHCTRIQSFLHLLKLIVGCGVDENVPTLPYTSSSTTAAKHKILCSHVLYLTCLNVMNQQSTGTNKQLELNNNNA
jgi:hypothetical protein